MVLGPIYHNDPSLPPAQNLENFWQYSKVYEGEVDENGDPTPEYYQERLRGFNLHQGIRYRRTKEKYLFSYWNGQKYDWQQAKRELYITAYVTYSQRTRGYHELQRMNLNGYNLLLLGYDGYAYSSDNDPSGDILKSNMDNDERPFGHEFVLAGMLTSKLVWERK
jgi:hypothetical protein